MIGHFQDLQIRPQSQRFQMLELLNDLMANYRSVIKEMGSESLVGITNLVSGEKDPRNLMIIFSILRAIMVEWGVVHEHAEVLHIFCIIGYPLMCADSLRFCLLLFSDYISASSR